MALSPPFLGSGRFVPARVWSCPVHDYDITYADEYDPWETEGEICLDCETGKWRDKKDAEGNVIMYELGVWEAMLLDHAAETLSRPNLLLQELARTPNPKAKIEWLEDESMPRIR